MSERVKLTKPQRELLERIAHNEKMCDPNYKPAVKLRQLGLAEMGLYRFGVAILRITPAGRAYLAEDRADG